MTKIKESAKAESEKKMEKVEQTKNENGNKQQQKKDESQESLNKLPGSMVRALQKLVKTEKMKLLKKLKLKADATINDKELLNVQGIVQYLVQGINMEVPEKIVLSWKQQHLKVEQVDENNKTAMELINSKPIQDEMKSIQYRVNEFKKSLEIKKKKHEKREKRKEKLTVIDPTVLLICGVGDCKAKFTSSASLDTHRMLRHKGYAKAYTSGILDDEYNIPDHIDDGDEDEVSVDQEEEEQDEDEVVAEEGDADIDDLDIVNEDDLTEKEKKEMKKRANKSIEKLFAKKNQRSGSKKRNRDVEDEEDNEKDDSGEEGMALEKPKAKVKKNDGFKVHESKPAKFNKPKERFDNPKDDFKKPRDDFKNQSNRKVFHEEKQKPSNNFKPKFDKPKPSVPAAAVDTVELAKAHPSWEAKAKKKKLESTAKFEGKKIVFDD